MFVLAQGPQPSAWNTAPGTASRCVDVSQGFEVATIQGLECLFGNVVTIVATLAGLVLFVMLLTGGVKYLTAGGDQKALEQAKNTMTYAILGLVLIIAAYLILNFLSTFTGIDALKTFKIPG